MNSHRLNIKFTILKKQDLDKEIPIGWKSSKKPGISLSIFKRHLTLKMIEWKCQLMAFTDLYF